MPSRSLALTRSHEGSVRCSGRRTGNIRGFDLSHRKKLFQCWDSSDLDYQMEQNQNGFDSEAAVAGAADEALPRPSATPFNLSFAPDAPGAGSGDPPSILDFDPVALRDRCDGWSAERQRAF